MQMDSLTEQASALEAGPSTILEVGGQRSGTDPWIMNDYLHFHLSILRPIVSLSFPPRSLYFAFSFPLTSPSLSILCEILH